MKLSEMIDNDSCIVLVGVSKKQLKILPKNIIGIERTNSVKELAEIYSTADIFVNPTREDNFPTVNMEAIACGTPVMTFNTGGSPEMIGETCGTVVACNETEAFAREISSIFENRRFSKEACIEHAKKFDMNDRFQEYIDLYKSIQ